MSKSLARMSAEEVAKDLTPKMRAFVDHYVSEGCSPGEAARVAGYSPGREDSQRQMGSQLLRKPHVQAYLFKRLAEQLAAGAPGALARINHLSRSAKSEYVQLEASKDILDRAGIRQSDQSKQGSGEVRVTIDLSGGTGGDASERQGGSKNPPIPLDPHTDT